MAIHYVCKECGYRFPNELTNLIKQNIQVYCERCGSPFILEGVEFKPASTPFRKFSLSTAISEKESLNLDSLIQFLNKISFLPIFIFTIISFGLIARIAINWDNWGSVLFNQSLLGLMGLLLLIYDRAYIAPKVREKKYNEILLDSFCWGILGCILFGTGVIILIKGIFIIFYVITDQRNKNLKAYDYGILAKDSINYFSSMAGLLIILIGIYRVYSERIYIPSVGADVLSIYNLQIPIIMIIYFGLLIVSFIFLMIDSGNRNEIKGKGVFELRDAVKIIIIGIMGTLFYGAGIFVLLKGLLILLLFVGKPSEKNQLSPIEEDSVYYQKTYKRMKPTQTPQPQPPTRRLVPKEVNEKPKEPVSEPPPIELVPKEKEIIPALEKKLEEDLGRDKKEDRVIKKEEKERKQKEFELRLHESLLPVKDDKDKKLVKQYFSKIFAVLSKELRQQIIALKIPKKEKGELLEELAFLTKEEQVKYIEALTDLYKEIPKKLIERIRKLSNVELKYLDKIVDQLKYMNTEEQIKFVQFLEENA